MKAIVYQKYGGPEVLKLKEVERPSVKENEVLIKVHSASINPFEWHHMRGSPLFARLSIGFFKPKHTILGMDVSGTVEETGQNITRFKKGDEVFGFSDFGGLAEFACVKEEKLSIKPAQVSFEEAAALPIAGITALQSVRDFARLKQGQTVLINGASGGVGLYTVQIAKIMGAEVTGICSTRNIELVKSAGADHVVDYTRKSVWQNGNKFDVIIDNVGNLSPKDYQQLLTHDGTCAVVGYTSISQIFNVMLKSHFGKGNIRMVSIDVTRKDLDYLRRLMDEGKLKSFVVRKYPISQIREAMTYLESGHARAKVIINIDGKKSANHTIKSKEFHQA